MLTNTNQLLQVQRRAIVKTGFEPALSCLKSFSTMGQQTTATSELMAFDTVGFGVFSHDKCTSTNCSVSKSSSPTALISMARRLSAVMVYVRCFFA